MHGRRLFLAVSRAACGHAPAALRGLVVCATVALVTAARPAAARPPPPAGREARAPRHRPRPSSGRAPLAAAPAPKADDRPGPPLRAPSFPVERSTLDNGLRVVLAPDHSRPLVALALTYDAGSRHEERGQAGLAALGARLFETAGSANLDAGERGALVAARGGSSRAWAEPDALRSLTLLPAGELPLGLWLEAERLRPARLSNESFEAARAFLLAADPARSGDPFALAEVRLRELAFQTLWPYEHPPQGSASSLETMPPSMVRSFYEGHLTPDNATLALVGDFEPDHAMQLVHRFFDLLPKGARAPASPVPALPEQSSPRAAVVEDARAAGAGLVYGWALPPAHGDEHDALRVAAAVLAGGDEGRLAQRLVRERGAASEVRASFAGHRGPDLLTLRVRLVEGQRRGEIEPLIEAELATLGRAGPSAAELERARAGLEASLYAELGSLEGRARRLGEYELFYGDARALLQDARRLGAVTAENVRAAVARHLTPLRRTLVEVRPAADAPPKAAPPGPAPAPAAPRHGPPRLRPPRRR
ncbi:MAG: insulinase family protein [Polyangiaceae bacterium]|nr:insulinase family protein [Polyangiaceae bacterium]